jgi:Transposase and inactivated derivatives
MPRKSREKSDTDIYHVMMRGINKQNIFEDDEDHLKFLEVLKDCKAISGFKIFAYCLMGNHLHLLIKVENEKLEQIFKRIGTRFVYWYNHKYGRTGHLFQDRYKSEPIDNESYLLTVLHYIHQNPVKAGICKMPDEYEWSSYKEYLEDRGITDRDSVLLILSLDNKESLYKLIRQAEETNAKSNLENEQYDRRKTDKEALNLISDLCKVNSPFELQQMSVKDRDRNLEVLKQNGLSIRQISRLTGISFAIVRK